MNWQKLFKKSRAVRPLYKRVQQTWGFSNEPDGREEVFYETSINYDALTMLAIKAATNKTGKAKDGALQVKIIERKRIESVTR